MDETVSPFHPYVSSYLLTRSPLVKSLHRFLPIQPSTLEFIREGRSTPGYSLFDWLHGYVYGRWTYLYLAIGTGQHPLARTFTRLAALLPKKKALPEEPVSGGFADGYHGKVVPLQAATQLVTINEPVQLPGLEKVIPYPKARDLILKNPQHILALDCPCRSARENPCLPMDVCLIVGDPFASFVEEHHPQRSRRITAQEAVDILRAEDARGHVHHAFFKDAMLNRFYAICNCCECCCGALHAHQHGTPMLASSGYLCLVDEDLCIACGECQTYCQFGAIHLEDYRSVIDQQACMGCGVCLDKCDQSALSLVRTPERGEPLEICDLLTSLPLPTSAGHP